MIYSNDTIELWNDYVYTHVGTKAARTFTTATIKPKNEFHTRIVLPQHFQPAIQDGIYLGISDNEFVDGRNHYQSEALVDATLTDWSKYTYFTNPLKIDKPIVLSWADRKLLNRNTKYVYDPPSARVRLGLFHTFTYEFDQDNIEFFKHQMSWLRSSHNPTDSPMGKLYQACSQWVDFEGITVAYSGNKSLHTHISFNTGLIRAQHADDPRPGLMTHWNTLKELVVQTLAPGEGIDPDLSMNEPEKYRRLPHGSRLLEHDNVMGIPAGTVVPQIALWEMYRDRASPAAKNSFFIPTLFVQPYQSKRSGGRSNSYKVYNISVSSPEMEYCGDRLREIFTDYPQFAGFELYNGQPRARFLNAPMDRHPNSYMDAEYSTVNIVGKNPYGLTPTTARRLPRKLGDMLEQWEAEYAATETKPRSKTEQAFAEASTDLSSATVTMATLLHEILGVNAGANQFAQEIQDGEVVFLSAPEGISKSRTLIAATPNIWWKLENAGYPSLIMYAFDSYKVAAEKAAEFNQAHLVGRYGQMFKAVQLPSFSELYRRACKTLGIHPIDAEMAAELGFSCVKDAIDNQQPGVIEFFAAFYKRLHKSIDGKTRRVNDRMSVVAKPAIPVIFTVHDVAHDWVKSTLTRQMFSKAYWDETIDPQTRHMRVRRDTNLGLLIHDEITAGDLIVMTPESVYQWVEAMRAYDPAGWKSGATQTAQWLAFTAFQVISPCPEDISFERVREITQTKDWEIVTPIYNEEYADGQDRVANGVVYHDIYANAVGRPWRIATREWAGKSAIRTIVLTTEFVPSAIVRKIGKPWLVYELDTPLIPRDRVDVQLSKGATAKSIANCVVNAQATYKAAHGRTLQVISNKVSHISSTATHSSAKGSNSFIGKNLLQTIMFMGVQQFEELEVLNAWTGRTDLVRSRHIDEYNQSVGRNMGFRYADGASHMLLINQRLYEYITIGEPFTRCRYDMILAQSRRDREALKPVLVKTSEAIPPAVANSKVKMIRLREKLKGCK